MLIAVVSSCFDDPNLSKPDSIYKAEVLDYLDRAKSNLNEEIIPAVDELMSSLDFKHVKAIKSHLGQEILFIPISSLQKVNGKYLQAIFYRHTNFQVTFGEVIAIDPTVENFNSPQGLIEDMINSKFSGYSGKFSVYSVYQDLKFFNSFDGGKISTNGKVRPKNVITNGSGRANACTDWYLVTTYYYSNGTSSSTSEFIGRSCDDCVGNTTRGNATMCGGSGGDGSGSLPNNPAVGTLVQVRLPNGVYKLLEWNCDDAHCFWKNLGTTVPAAVVETSRPEYWYLPVSPYSGQFILGPDGLSYKYNANYMQWEGVKNVENYVNTPCLKSLIENIRNNDIMADVQRVFNQVFNNNDNLTMLMFTESSNPGYVARTFQVSSTGYNVDLNTTVMSNASNEYNAVTLYHEIVHGILYTRGMADQLAQHHEILNSYVDQIAQAALSLYPNLSVTDARAISMAGLGDVLAANPSLYDQLAAQFGLTRAQIAEIAKSYRRDNDAGNTKKGSPCTN